MLEVLFVFICGLFIGSFLLVVADRVSTGRKFVSGRSVCEFCGHTLAWYELIPVLSYFIQGRACRHCHKKLSLWYPVAEVLTGILISIVYVAFFTQGWIVIGITLLIVCCLFVIFVADYKYEIIPFPVVVTATVLELILLLLQNPGQILIHFLAGVGAALFFLIIFLVTKGKGMGFGDVVYALLMGLILGFPAVFFGLYIAFISGAVMALVLVFLKKKKLHGGTIPFGPFLVFGTFTMMIVGSTIIKIAATYF